MLYKKTDDGLVEVAGYQLTYDFKGTQAEYEVAKANGTIQDGWVIFITDDVSNVITTGTAALNSSVCTSGTITWIKWNQLVQVSVAVVTVSALSNDTTLATGLPVNAGTTVASVSGVSNAAGYPISVISGTLKSAGGAHPAQQIHGGFMYIAKE